MTTQAEFCGLLQASLRIQRTANFRVLPGGGMMGAAGGTDCAGPTVTAERQFGSLSPTESGT